MVSIVADPGEGKAVRRFNMGIKGSETNQSFKIKLALRPSHHRLLCCLRHLLALACSAVRRQEFRMIENVCVVRTSYFEEAQLRERIRGRHKQYR